MDKDYLTLAHEWHRCRAHPESPRRSRRKPLDVDVSLRVSRRSNADARPRSDARSRHSSLGQELAARVN